MTPSRLESRVRPLPALAREAARATALAAALAVALAPAVLVAGCTGPNAGFGRAPAGPGSATPSRATAPDASSATTPGVHDLGGGRVRVVGLLESDPELEGGVVGVRLNNPWDSTLAELVVIANPGELRDLPRARTEGWVYVAVTGRMLDGASIRMAGPEIEAESIEKADLKAPWGTR